jgi:hypothetical protein
MGYLIVFGILALIGLCSYFIARKVFKALKKNHNAYPVAISIVIFILSFTIILAVIIYIISRNIYFGR